MTTFANDIDLLHWEPNIFIDALGVAQPVISGTGDLSGTNFTIGSGSLIDARVSDEHVIVLSGPVVGSFPIISVDTETELTLSVLYDELYSDENLPPPPGEGTGVGFSIRTFWPQRNIVTEQILQAANVKPENFASILNPQVLRRPCVLGTLQMIYSALAAGSEDPAHLLTRAELYERLFRRSMRSAMVEIDTNNDGSVDARRSLSIVELRRA